MKTLKYIFSLSIALVFFANCSKEYDDLSFLDKVVAPTNVSALFQITQDNTGLVTITPNALGASNYNIKYGDESTELVNVLQGESISHIYKEGTYTVNLEAIGLTGLKSEVTQDLVVSFRAPENLVVTIENDPAISKQVNVKATADFGVSYNVYFGEAGNDNPVSGNMGDTVSYTYEEAGIYTIRVVAMSAAIETLEYTEEFEVTAILQPLEAAPVPRRDQSDVISIYSDSYANPDPIDYNPNWGQATTYTQIDIEGNNMIQYGGITYQGIDFSSAAIDASAMEFLHVDVWTADENFNSKLSPISSGPNETAYDLELTAYEWKSFDIPISFFTDQNPDVNFSDIIQFKFEGVESGAGTIFIDNLYFYKASSGNNGPLPLTFEANYALSSFDGGETIVVANPETNGNTSANVLQLVKGTGQPWAGHKITIEQPFDFSGGLSVTAKVWSPRVGLNLLMKFEDNVPWPGVSGTVDAVATTTVANQWETLTFTWPDIDEAIDWYNLVMIMDNGTNGNGSSDYTIFVDDISTNPELNFEPGYSLSSFDGGETTTIVNPDMSGINTSANVLELVKGAGQPWAGHKVTVDKIFNIGGATTITAKVWSPRVGLDLLMKFEDNVPWPGVSGTLDAVATTTVANQWETLTFTWTDIDDAIEWYNLVMIMDNGTQGDGTANYTIYVDDISNN